MRHASSDRLSRGSRDLRHLCQAVLESLTIASFELELSISSVHQHHYHYHDREHTTVCTRRAPRRSIRPRRVSRYMDRGMEHPPDVASTSYPPSPWSPSPLSLSADNRKTAVRSLPIGLSNPRRDDHLRPGRRTPLLRRSVPLPLLAGRASVARVRDGTFRRAGAVRVARRWVAVLVYFPLGRAWAGREGGGEVVRD
jgi:hypothetical protein